MEVYLHLSQLPELCTLTNYMPRGFCRHGFAIVEHHDSVNTTNQCSSGRTVMQIQLRVQMQVPGLVDNQGLVR